MTKIVLLSPRLIIQLAPTRYAIKAYGNVVSGDFAQKNVKVGAYQKFRRVNLNIDNISEIISVFDNEGNEYFEVDYLPNMVYKELKNKNYKNDNVLILKPMLVSENLLLKEQRLVMLYNLEAVKMVAQMLLQIHKMLHSMCLENI